MLYRPDLFCLPCVISEWALASYDANKLVTASETVGFDLRACELGMTASQRSWCELLYGLPGAPEGHLACVVGDARDYGNPW